MNDNMIRVLRFLAEHFSRPDVYRLNTPFEVPGLTFDEQTAPALSRLASASPPYITGVSASQASYPIVVLGLTERGWETAESVGDANDASPGGPASIPIQTATSADNREFQVALSFAGEQREYVERVYSALARIGVTAFYDEEEVVRLWGRNLIEAFQEIYMNDSHAVAMFISSAYAEKPWTQHERRSALSRALEERREYVLPVRFDDAVLPGLDPAIGYLRADDYSPERLAELLAEKLVQLGISLPALKSEGSVSTYPIPGQRLEVTAVSGGRPVVGAGVLAVARNGVFVSGATDEAGVAILVLPAERLVTVFVAHERLAAAIIRDHDPRNGLAISLVENGEGSVIFEAGTGDIPGLNGRLNPIRDNEDRLYIYADNIAIDDDPHQPRSFELGQPMILEDSAGVRREIRVVEIIGRSSLLAFR